MALSVGTASGNKDAIEIVVGTSGGNKIIVEGYVGTAGGNKIFHATEPLTAISSPDTDTWGEFGPSDWRSSTITCTPSGGAAPYTYLWDGLAAPSNVTGQSTTWSLTSPVTTVVWCDVTDALGNTARSNDTTIYAP